MGDDMLQAALQYAELGWPVFPAAPDKTPLTRHGFQDATLHQGLIRSMWKKHDGANVALGIPEGLVVLDFDPRNGAPPSDAFRWGERIPLTCHTPSGGEHFYFRVDPDLRLAGKLMPGVDVKVGGKGYVLLPPSRTENGCYTWEGWGPTELGLATELTDLPDWCLVALKREDLTATLGQSSRDLVQPAFPWELGTQYGTFGLQQKLGELILANNGERNKKLNDVGFRCGRLVAAGELKEDALHEVARVAELIGLPREEIANTLISSFEAGTRSPWRR